MSERVSVRERERKSERVSVRERERESEQVRQRNMKIQAQCTPLVLTPPN